jgi:hypothetical protein
MTPDLTSLQNRSYCSGEPPTKLAARPEAGRIGFNDRGVEIGHPD